MIVNETESIKEIRRIREKQYEETKGMTIEERMAYDRKRTEKLAAEFDLRLNYPTKTM